MDLEALLTAFLSDVETFARHQGIWEAACFQAPEFPADVVEQVLDDSRDRAIDALQDVMKALPEVEGAAAQVRARIRALEVERVDLENALDALELQRSIGSLDDLSAADEVERLRTRMDALADEQAALEDGAARIERALARWADVGADHAVTA